MTAFTAANLPASLAALAAAYLLGAVPFGLMLARAFGHGDLRALGSGNIGATNALRAGGPFLGAATLLLDAAKGAAPVFLLRAMPGGEPLALLGGLSAFLGHLFPVWLRFRGGKGVATLIGVALAAAPVVGGAVLATWAAAAALARRSSVGGIAAALAAPAAALALGRPHTAGVLALMAVLTVWKHRANIARLRAGTEPRIGARG